MKEKGDWYFTPSHQGYITTKQPDLETGLRGEEEEDRKLIVNILGHTEGREKKGVEWVGTEKLRGQQH